MRLDYRIPLIILPISAVLFIIIYYFRSAVDTALGTQAAGNYLVIILIIVDGLGSLSSYFIWRADKKAAAANKPELSIVYEPEGSPAETYQQERHIRVRTPTGYKEEGRRSALRVAVENNGKADAENCRARFRIMPPFPDNSIVPSGEPKSLVWEKGEIATDISSKDYVFLDVVLSDNRVDVHSKGFYGFIATSKVKENREILYPNEGFGAGDFTFELVVTAKGGATAKANFRLHLDADYHKISMHRAD